MTGLLPDPASYWSSYYTAFPYLAPFLEDVEHAHTRPRAVVIGASDGKFVIPLVQQGWDVLAVEMDEVFVRGGYIQLRDGAVPIGGLISRLDELGLTARCEIVDVDYMEWIPPVPFQLAITSGLWSMPVNREWTLADLVHQQQAYVAPGGLLFADYFLPTNEEERATGVVPEPPDVEALFDDEWEVLRNREEGRFGESHYGWEEWHEHRYASVIARRRPVVEHEW